MVVVGIVNLEAVVSKPVANDEVIDFQQRVVRRNLLKHPSSELY